MSTHSDSLLAVELVVEKACGLSDGAYAIRELVKDGEIADAMDDLYDLRDKMRVAIEAITDAMKAIEEDSK